MNEAPKPDPELLLRTLRARLRASEAGPILLGLDELRLLLDELSRLQQSNDRLRRQNRRVRIRLQRATGEDVAASDRDGDSDSDS